MLANTFYLMPSMYCPTCKLLLSEYDASCYNCGTKIEQKSKPVATVVHKKSEPKNPLYEVAKAQKIAIWMMLGMLLGGIGLTPVAMIFGVIGMYFLATALKKRYVPLWMLAMLIPAGNFIILFIVGTDATAFLKKHGVHVGLLGANMSDVEGYSKSERHNPGTVHKKASKKRNFWGDAIETKEEAEKVIRNSSLFFLIISLLSILIGLSTSIIYTVSGIVILIPTLVLRQNKSQVAAVVLLLAEIGEIAARIESDVKGLIIPIIGIWLSIKAVRATFIWHKLKKQHSAKHRENNTQ